MFDAFKTTISNIVGGPPTAAATAARRPNDAAGPSCARPSRPSHSPTAVSHSSSRTIDLTSPAKPNKASSSDRGRPVDLPKSSNTSSGHNKAKPVAGGPSKTKATPLPDPRFHFAQKRADMKPGANHAPQPKNTLNQPTYHVPGSAKKTYARPSGFHSLAFLDEQPRPDAPPVKKRKVGTTQPQAIHVYDDVDGIEEVGSEHLGGRPASRRSAGSGHTSVSGSKKNQSEFARADALTDPRRRRSRVTVTTGNTKSTNGHAPSSPIELDDEAPSCPAHNQRQTQMQQFRQGDSSSKEAQATVTVSRHFAPQMNRSTRPAGSPPRNNVRKSEDVRGFRRTAAVASTTPKADARPASRDWPLRWARAHNYEKGAEDIVLRSGAPKEYCIISSDTFDTVHELSFDHVVRAMTDGKSRIRLIGPANNDGSQYLADLEFEEKADLHAFLQKLMLAITQKNLVSQGDEFMKKIFSKPLAVPSRPSNTVPVSNNDDEVEFVSNISRGPGLIDRLVGQKRNPVSQQPSNRSTISVVKRETPRISERPIRTTRTSRALSFDEEDYAPDEPKVERFSEIHGLGTPWKKQLEYGRTVVDFQDLTRLDEGDFLNDQLIDFYLRYMFDQMKASRDRIKIFNSHFFTTLTRKERGQKLINYQGVARWTAREDIFGYDYIMVPINENFHWYLAIICNVSNIARKPVIEDLTADEGLKSDVSNGPNSELGAKQTNVSESIPPPALVEPPSRPSVPAQSEMKDADDSDLNVVDAYATETATEQDAQGGSSSVVESPAAETAQLKKLSLSDSKSDGVLPIGSSFMPSPKKTKRKLGLPLRKWDPTEPVVIVLDSLGGGARSASVRALKEYILQEGQDKRGMEATIKQNAYYAKESQIPQQPNYCDCGVYLLGYAQKFFEDPDEFKNRLLSGEMRADIDWPDMDIPKMRHKIRDILQKLYREQDEERKKLKASKQKTTDNTKVEPTPAVASSEKQTAATAIPSTDTVAPEEPKASVEAKLSTSPKPQLQPRLASPFEHQPQPLRKRSRSRSTSVLAPIKVDGSPAPEAERQEKAVVDGYQISPTLNSFRKSRSPIVLIESPGKKSPKRPLPESVAGDDTVETIPKKPRTEAKQVSKTIPATRGDVDVSEMRLVGIRSPDPKTEGSTKRRPKTPLSASPRKQNVPSYVKGSSHDPIPIDDSQEILVSTPKPGTPKARHASEEPGIIIKSPKEPRAIRLAPSRQRREAKSSPIAKRDQERGSPNASTKQAPFMAEALDAKLKEDSAHMRSRQEISKWRNRNPFPEDIPEKPKVIEETPPPEQQPPEQHEKRDGILPL